ncbi:hypothetical protein ACIQLJ_12855 [Microbacterium sp. NPDC091313]
MSTVLPGVGPRPAVDATPFAFLLIDRERQIWLTRYASESWHISARRIPPVVLDAVLRAKGIGRLVDYDIAALRPAAELGRVTASEIGGEVMVSVDY